jgi:hypothetical protein
MLRALGRTVALGQSLGLAVLAIVSVLGTWPLALYGVEPPEDHLPDALT